MTCMKAERLIALLTMLLSGKRLSARELARELEVSVRTVYRDAEALCEAGFPVYATAGRDGGFGLVEGFSMTGQMFATGEVQRVLSALDGLAGVCPASEIETLRRKFTLLLGDSAAKGVPCPQQRVFIELAPSGRERRSIDSVDEAIKNGAVLRIRYCDASGSATERDIEPVALVFYWQSWFVYAWCRLRDSFRCFRVARIQSVERLGLERTGPPCDLTKHPWTKEWEGEPFDDIEFVADKSAQGRVFEYFDASAIEERDDGTILVRGFFPMGEWVVSWIMGLPGAVRIIAPDHLRERVYDRAKVMAEKNLRPK